MLVLVLLFLISAIMVVLNVIPAGKPAAALLNWPALFLLPALYFGAQLF